MSANPIKVRLNTSTSQTPVPQTPVAQVPEFIMMSKEVEQTGSGIPHVT